MSALAARKRRPRWVTALVLATMVAWAVYVGCSFVPALFSDRPGVMDATWATAVVSVPFALVVCLIVGVPALLVAEALKLSRWWQAAAVGAAGGLAAFLLVKVFLSGVASGVSLDAEAIMGVLIFALAGACAGVSAWASLWLDGKYTAPPRKEAKP